MKKSKSLSINIEKLLVVFYASFLSGVGYILFQIFVRLVEKFNINISQSYFGVSSFYLFLIAIVFLFFFIKLLKKEKISNYGFKRLKANDLRFTFLLFSLFFIVSVFSRIVTPSFDAWYSTRLKLSDINTILKLLIIVIPISVVVEELITRSMIQSYLSKYFGGKISVLTITLYFSLFHLGWMRSSPKPSYLLVILIYTLLFSFFAAMLYEKTKSVILTILLHLMINSINLGQIFLHKINSPLEILLWLFWGIMFFMFLKRSLRALISDIKSLKSKQINKGDVMYLALILVMPMILIIL